MITVVVVGQTETALVNPDYIMLATWADDSSVRLTMADGTFIYARCSLAELEAKIGEVR